MKTIIDRKNLVAALQIVLRAVSSRSTQPILGNTLIEASKEKLLFTATDLEISLQLAVEARVEEEGATTVPARLLSEIASNLPSGEVTLSQPEEGELTLLQGRSKYAVRTLPAESYPQLPELEEGADSIAGAAAFQQAVKRVIFAASQDETRPVFTGVLLDIKGNTMNVVATDGHRLAQSTLEMEKTPAEDLSLIIPGRALQELARFGAEEEERMHIRTASGQAAFFYEKMTLVSRLIEGNYPNYRQVIPRDLPFKAIVSREGLLQAVKGAHIMAREGANVIKIGFSDNCLTVTAATQDVGEVYEEVQAEYGGESLEIAFNARYLLDVLSTAEEDALQVEVGGPLKPVLIKAQGEEGYVYVVMPVKMG